jgi:hypothetical protein
VSEAADWPDNEDNIRYLRRGPVGPVPDPKTPGPSWRFFLAEILVLGGALLGMLLGLWIGYSSKVGTYSYWAIGATTFIAGFLAMALWSFYMAKWVRTIINGEDR